MIKPFTMAYVLKTTVQNMRKMVDISIYKTTQRWEEFKDDPVKCNEITKTLMRLHNLKNLLDQFQREYKEEFDGK